MMRFARLPLAALTSFTLVVQAAESTAQLRGYSADETKTERDWEKRFRDLPKPDNIRETMRRMSAHPHHVGSPYDKNNAEWVLAQFKSWGLDAKIEEFSALFPTPKDRLVELIAPTKFKAKLEEPTLAIDPTSDQHKDQLPTYNAYSRDGDVTAPLVYVNYGIPADYEQLERMGISVKGAIVIARYGESWRGIKPKLAAEHGAVGCLIYSDPAGDGYVTGVAYPDGPARPQFGVQRGSVMDMPTYPGDPQTPGVGATADAKLIPLDQVQTITKIPVLPISSSDAEPLLRAIQGEMAPAGWRGALPFPYHVGPSAATVHLRLHFNFDRKPLYDIIARIPGSQFPEEWVIRGNHHDAWVNGAEDPLSGTSPLMEEARAMSELLKLGWKPKRTIVFCVWDGEEPGLLGSTEWAETHADELKTKAVAYINSDVNGRGFLSLEGSHTLENFANEVAKDIEDPETKLSAWNRSRLNKLALAAGIDKKSELRGRADLRIEALGSGSDYTVFLDHLGVASINLGFFGEQSTGEQYHSIYDDFYWYTHYSDTDFVYGRALAQTAGTMLLRLADANVIPLQFTDFADTIQVYDRELKKLSEDKRAEIEERNKEIDEGLFTAVDDPKHKLAVPKREELPPHLNFAPLDNSVDALVLAAASYEKALAAAGDHASLAINANLIQSERLLTDPAGLPNREWFRNMIYAPGYYTGYGVKTLPAIREAIDQKQWTLADEQIIRVAKVLDGETALLNATARQLAK